MNRNAVIAVATLTLAVGLTSCSTDTSADDPATEETSSEASTPAPEQSESEASDPDVSEDSEASSDESDPDDGTDDSDGSEELIVTIDGSDQTLDLTNVYCDGSPDNIENIIGKTNNQPPLLKVTGDHFAMLKLQKQGAPEKANSPSGLSYGPESVTFSDTTIGSAVVNGTMTCTDWDD